MTENEYFECLKRKKEIRDYIYKIKVEIAFSTSNNKKTILEEKCKIIKKKYAENLIKIIEYEKEKENEEYKRR